MISGIRKQNKRREIAIMEIDNCERRIDINLHGYSVADAIDTADEKIIEAWQNGFKKITFVHGAATSTHHFSAKYTGYGGIKWSLRSRLAQGDWMKYIYNRRSVKHIIGDTFMTLSLRPNSNPKNPPEWSHSSKKS